MKMMGKTMSVMTGIAAGVVIGQFMNDKNMRVIKRAWKNMM